MKNICIVCGNEFDAIKSTKKYCSQKCNNEMRRIRYAENKKIQENNLAIIEKNLKLEWGNNYDISNFRYAR